MDRQPEPVSKLPVARRFDSRRVQVVLLALLVPALLLGYRGVIDTEDGLIRYQGAIAILGGEGYRAEVRGQVFTIKYGILHSALGIPFILAGRLAAPAIGGAVIATNGLADTPAMRQFLNEAITRGAFLLVNPLATLATAVILLRLLLHLGGAPRRALLLTLLWALGSPALVYANLAFDEPLQGLFLLAGIAAAVHGRGGLTALGFGLAALVRPVAFLALPAGWLILDGKWTELTPSRRRLLAAGAAVIGFQLVYNWLIHGSPVATGYGGERFSTPLPVGLAGMLAAPGKSIFIYFPAALILPAALVFLWRQNRRLALAVGYLFLAYLLLYAGWWDWSGDTCWGPRFLVPLLPLAVIPLALFPARRWFLPLVAIALIAGLAVNLPGALVGYTEGWIATLVGAGNDGDLALARWRSAPAWFPPLVQLRLLRAGGPDTLLLAGAVANLLPGLAYLRWLLALVFSGGLAAVFIKPAPRKGERTELESDAAD